MCRFYGWTIPDIKRLTLREFRVFKMYMVDELKRGQ